MPGSFSTFDFSDLPHGQAYEILVSTIHPRPIAFVSSISKEGHLNLAPFSFFMIGGSNPPSLAYSPTMSSQGPKDSLRNVEETGEFVVNLVHREIADQMNLTAKAYPSEVSEWEMSGFTPLPSVKVAPPRVAESLVHFECKLFEIVNHGDGAGAARYVIGEVLTAHIDSSLIEEGVVVEDRVRPIARIGGPNYLDTGSLEFFSLIRPK